MKYIDRSINFEGAVTHHVNNKRRQRKRAEAVMKQYVNSYPCARAFLRFAKWAEFEAKDIALARTIFEAIFTDLEPEEYEKARVFKQFASFEQRQNEYKRAKVVYNHAIQLFQLEGMTPAQQKKQDLLLLSDYELNKRQELYKSYIHFEQKYGNKDQIHSSIYKKQKQLYTNRIETNQYDYDAWIELAKLHEQHAATDVHIVRDTYEHAISKIPLVEQKSEWKRYIYIWIYYALYEELTNKNIQRASSIYQACLNVI